MTSDRHELHPWHDADDLLKALYRLGKEPVDELRDAVRALLDHHDPDIREEALRVLLTRWKSRDAREHAVAAVQGDPAPQVRCAAATAIAATALPETRAHDTELLLSIVLDESENTEVRGAAYEALLIMYRERGFPPGERAFVPSTDVDWVWIRSLPQPDHGIDRCQSRSPR